MKKILLALMTALLFSATTQAKVRVEVERDSQGNKLRTLELRDTVIGGNGMTDSFTIVTDTLSIVTYHSSVPDSERASADSYEPESESSRETLFEGRITTDLEGDMLVSIVAIVAVFGCPAILIFIIFYFRYKNRKAKYRLAELALEKGQPLPAELFEQTSAKREQSILNKGIKNIFLGIGLFLLLWTLTDELGLGCIGLLIMFTGCGQVLIHYLNQPRKQDNGVAERRSDNQPSGEL